MCSLFNQAASIYGSQLSIEWNLIKYMGSPVLKQQPAVGLALKVVQLEVNLSA